MESNLPQMEDTGVSSDYWNQYNVFPLFGLRDFSPKENLELLQKWPVQRYTEYFSLEEGFEGVITDFNRGTIERLDELADEVNALASPERFSIEKFRGILGEVYELLYGVKSSLLSG